MNSDRWNIQNTWYEGKRVYVEITCSVCSEHVTRVRQDALLPTGKGRSCACTRKPAGKPLNEGERFGKLVVLGRDSSFSDGKNVKWLVRCDCGSEKSLPGSQLRSGSTKSCGCSLAERRGSKMENHGMSGSKEYQTWASIISRTSHAFESTRRWYYDKGIGMSDDWRTSFTRFYEDMGDCPEGYSIDRIDPEKGYSKENCRWASLPMQSINKGIGQNNTSGYKGVSETKYGTWVAYIYIDRKRFHLGTYTTAEEANEARIRGEEKYWSHIKE